MQSCAARIARQRFAVPGLDQHREQRQVAAEVEHTLHLRSGDVVVRVAGFALEQHAPLVQFELLVVRPDVVQQPEAEARHALRVEHPPDHAVLGVELDFELAGSVSPGRTIECFRPAGEMGSSSLGRVMSMALLLSKML
jgi:hypothetical protein